MAEEKPFFLIIDPDSNMSKGYDVTEAWGNYTCEHNQYVLDDCHVLECNKREVRIKLEFL